MFKCSSLDFTQKSDLSLDPCIHLHSKVSFLWWYYCKLPMLWTYETFWIMKSCLKLFLSNMLQQFSPIYSSEKLQFLGCSHLYKWTHANLNWLHECYAINFFLILIAEHGVQADIAKYDWDPNAGVLKLCLNSPKGYCDQMLGVFSGFGN